MDFRFTNDWPVSMTDEVVSYLLGPRLWIPVCDYPDFGDWTQKVHADLKAERKRALLALSGGIIVGAVVYQRHAVEFGTIEFKNISVRPDERGRLVASFLVRNAEVEGARDFGATRVVVDAKASNRGIRLFLERQGYRIAERRDLYGLGTGDDLVFRKRLVPRPFLIG
jgi:ribosomal protein S18 acetylase RimI-like enzyme